MSIRMPLTVAVLLAVYLPDENSAEELPTNIQAALQANAQALTGLQLVGFQERKLLKNAAEGLKELGTLEPEEAFTQRVRFTLKLQGGKFYEAFNYPRGVYHSGDDTSERSFDETKYFTGTNRPSNQQMPGMLIISSPQTLKGAAGRAVGSKLAEFWYLLEAGFDAPAHPDDLGRSVRSLALTRMESGNLISSRSFSDGGRVLYEVEIDYPEPWASQQQHDIATDPFIQGYRAESRKLQVEVERERRGLSERKRKCRLWLDPQLNYAVREKWEMRETGKTMFHTKCKDFVQVEKTTLWLPKRCEVTSHAYETRPAFTADDPIYVTEIQLTELTPKTFKAEDFRLWYAAPGVLVSDYTHSKATADRGFVYWVPASGDELDKAARSKWTGSGIQWVLLANVIMFIAIVSFIAWNRMRKTKAES